MIDVARVTIEEDENLHKIFDQCIKDTGINPDNVRLTKVYSELSKKII